MRTFTLTPTQFADYLLEDPEAELVDLHDLHDLHDLRARVQDGRLRIVSAPREREVHLVSETPIEGPGAIARWIALLDRAEDMQQHAHDAEHPHLHSTLQRQIARAIDSLFLYEHQMLPAARREARESLWQRDRAEPLPPSDVRAQWEWCRCRRCLLARITQRPTVAAHLPTPAARTSPPAPAPLTSLAPVPSRRTRRARPAQRRLLSPMAQAS
jgi:hypothetical protein